MKILKFLMLAIFLAIIVLKLLPHKDKDLEVNPSWQKTVEYAKEHLQTEGKLIRKSDGFVYLKVDDNYIHTLFPMLELKEKGFRKPPYFRGRESPGAHISVFYEDEAIRPDEIGSYFHFTPKSIVIVKPSDGVSYAVLEVDAPELENLRKKYGLSPKLKGHEFHISLAKKVKHPRHPPR